MKSRYLKATKQPARHLYQVRPLGRRSIILQQPSRTQYRLYAEPSKLQIPQGVSFKPPPPPAKVCSDTENEHIIDKTVSSKTSFDRFLEDVVLDLDHSKASDITTMYSQYRARSGRVLEMVIPYEERPRKQRRADIVSQPENGTPTVEGDGIVMVVHIVLKENGKLEKICACSGFAVDALPVTKTAVDADIIITCAHTLEEMNRHILRNDSQKRDSFSIIIPSDGEPRLVSQVLSSMPRSDVIALEVPLTNTSPKQRLRTLPLSPFPVYNGDAILTHLFGAEEPPTIAVSESRVPDKVKSHPDIDAIQKPIPWLQQKAWRRWGAGTMLGYRSYTGIEVEAGIHSSLPHIQTSVLPTPGSSGGPLVCSETGSVVGISSGRRMDNRIEGERGWGTSAESIFEMFALPGFTPACKD